MTMCSLSLQHFLFLCLTKQIPAALDLKKVLGFILFYLNSVSGFVCLSVTPSWRFSWQRKVEQSYNSCHLFLSERGTFLILGSGSWNSGYFLVYLLCLLQEGFCYPLWYPKFDKWYLACACLSSLRPLVLVHTFKTNSVETENLRSLWVPAQAG